MHDDWVSIQVHLRVQSPRLVFGPCATARKQNSDRTRVATALLESPGAPGAHDVTLPVQDAIARIDWLQKERLVKTQAHADRTTLLGAFGANDRGVETLAG